jgi:uncharacterized protein YbaP (TraB family)
MKQLFFFILFFSINSTLFSQNTILWEITKKGSEKKSFLLGTYHQLGSHYLDSFPLIKAKLIQSDIAIFESLQLEKEKAYILNRPDNFSYKKHFNKKQTKALQSIGNNWRFPLHKLTIGEIRLLIEKEYYKQNCSNYLENDSLKLQFDSYLQSIAIDNNLDVLGLENDSLQSIAINAYLNKFSKKELKEQVLFWLNALELAKNHAGLCAFPRQYKSLNLPYEFEETCPENDFFIKGRNIRWTPTLLSKLNNNNCFIAVGFNHLCFQCGLIEILKKNGFDVTPIKLK